MCNSRTREVEGVPSEGAREERVQGGNDSSSSEVTGDHMEYADRRADIRDGKYGWSSRTKTSSPTRELETTEEIGE